MPDEHTFDVDEDYEDDVYYVFKDQRSTKGCICDYKSWCKCRVMIMPVKQ